MLSNSSVGRLISDTPRIWYDDYTDLHDVEHQCDCACAVSSLAPQSSLTVVLPVMRLLFPFIVVHLSTDRHAILTGQTPSAVVLNDAALAMAQHFQQPRALADLPERWSEQWGTEAVTAALARLVQVGILTAVGQTELQPSNASSTLVAWLHLTERCNLRCSYCYLSPGTQDMTLDTGRAALEATFRSASTHNYRQVKLKYAGGEPLLRFSLVSDLHRHAQALAIQHGVDLDGVVLSNGTLLTTAMIETIKSLNLRLMISLDGLQLAHDQHRLYANGRGSFVKVEQAIDLALAHGLVPEISVTVSDINVTGLPELVAWLLERDLPFGFNYYREHACSVGRSKLRLTEQAMIDGMLQTFAVIEQNLPRRSLMASLVDHANLVTPHMYPCQAGRNYLVFDTLGRVAHCQMQIDQAVDVAADVDPVALVRRETTTFQNPLVDAKPACSDCAWKYWCAGGCPLATWRATGRFDARSPYCDIYQTLFPAALRLEGLRVLKYAA